MDKKLDNLPFKEKEESFYLKKSSNNPIDGITNEISENVDKIINSQEIIFDENISFENYNKLIELIQSTDTQNHLLAFSLALNGELSPEHFFSFLKESCKISDPQIINEILTVIEINDTITSDQKIEILKNLFSYQNKVLEEWVNENGEEKLFDVFEGIDEKGEYKQFFTLGKDEGTYYSLLKNTRKFLEENKNENILREELEIIPERFQDILHETLIYKLEEYKNRYNKLPSNIEHEVPRLLNLLLKDYPNTSNEWKEMLLRIHDGSYAYNDEVKDAFVVDGLHAAFPGTDEAKDIYLSILNAPEEQIAYPQTLLYTLEYLIDEFPETMELETFRKEINSGLFKEKILTNKYQYWDQEDEDELNQLIDKMEYVINA